MSDRPSDKTNLAKNALNKAAEICVSSQIDSVEDLEIDINSQPERLLQGKVDSINPPFANTTCSVLNKFFVYI